MMAMQQAQAQAPPQGGGQPNVPGGVGPGNAPPNQGELLQMMQGGQANL